ncbi:hypothetical protein [Xanthomonas perforans]|uniref:hypothetical protein n=1 Tax=Xanthomonas perforans TaxID=442694 RepID=UPI0013DF6748|nr:hypothetical protein [Xanthomonas perforans]
MFEHSLQPLNRLQIAASRAGNGAVAGARGGNLESIQWLKRMLEHDRTGKPLLMP